MVSTSIRPRISFCNLSALIRRSAAMNVVLPFLLSLDSLIVSTALSVRRLSRAQQVKLATAFGVCDGFASFLSGGTHFATSHWWKLSSYVQVTIWIYLTSVILAWLLSTQTLRTRHLLWTIPIILSVDNLLAPTALPSSTGSVLLVAVASCSMSLFGFGIGATARDFVLGLPASRNSVARPIS